MLIGGLAVLLPLTAPHEVRADTHELSVRCGPRLLSKTDVEFGGEVVSLSAGPRCLLGAGLSPSLTMTIGYGFARSGALRIPDGEPGTSYVFRRHRHDLGGGLSWAPSDALTPVVSLDLGGTALTTVDPQRRLATPNGERRVPPFPATETTWSPRVGLEVALEWRYLDQASIGGGPFADWADGRFAVGAGLWFAVYRYF